MAGPGDDPAPPDQHIAQHTGFQPGPVIAPQARYRRQRHTLRRIPALEIDQICPAKIGGKNLAEPRHLPDPMATQREIHTVRSIAIPQIQPLQRGKILRPGHAHTIGLTLQPPIMENRENPVPGQMHIQFDHLRPMIERRPH